MYRRGDVSDCALIIKLSWMTEPQGREVAARNLLQRVLIVPLAVRAIYPSGPDHGRDPNANDAYGYAKQNPVTNMDPTGLLAEAICADIAVWGIN